MRISKTNAGVIRAAIAIARDHMDTMLRDIHNGAQVFIDPMDSEPVSVRNFLYTNDLAARTYERTIMQGTIKLISSPKSFKQSLVLIKIRDGFHD